MVNLDKHHVPGIIAWTDADEGVIVGIGKITAIFRVWNLSGTGFPSYLIPRSAGPIMSEFHRSHHHIAHFFGNLGLDNLLTEGRQHYLPIYRMNDMRLHHFAVISNSRVGGSDLQRSYGYALPKGN